MFLTIIISFNLFSLAQVSLSGPVCVVSGTEYQYVITGSWKADSNVEICINGGVIKGTNLACKSGTPQSFVRVFWDHDKKSGKLTISSSEGNASLDVTLAEELNAGTIASAGKKQTIDYNTIPEPIACGTATGGGCAPAYTYQWQQSFDHLTWIDVTGEANTTLSFSIPLKKATYFRRKVTESYSNNIGFSNVAIVYVKADEEKRP